MSDGAAKRAAAGTFHIEVNPLVVTGGIGKLLDAGL